MNRIASVALLSLCAMTCFSAPDNEPCPQGMSEEEFDFLKREGGYVNKPNTGHGVFAFVNGQTVVPQSELTFVVKCVEAELGIAAVISAERGKADAWVDIVDRPGESALVIYPDEKHATVNVAPLKRGAPDSKVLASRLRKEMFRGLSFVLGISGGGEPGGILDVMTDLKRLDAAAEEIPGDLVLRFEKYALRSGIKPYYHTTYSDACQEGWAPAPTNKWQKAIWDKAHEIPSEPIKIKYQKPKGK